MHKSLIRFWQRNFPLKKEGPFYKNTVHIGRKLLKRGSTKLRFEKNAHNNHVLIGDECEFTDVRIRFTGENSKLTIGNNVRWKGYILIHGNNRTVTIGQNTTCMGAFIMCRDADIHIGKNCMFSRGIEIRSSDVHKIIDGESNEQLNKPKDTYISDRVWLAANVTVSKGAKIPKESVVGAMSFVNQAFEEPYIIIAGTPAKIVRKNIRWHR